MCADVMQQTMAMVCEQCRKLDVKMKMMMKTQAGEWNSTLESYDQLKNIQQLSEVSHTHTSLSPDLLQTHFPDVSLFLCVCLSADGGAAGETLEAEDGLGAPVGQESV